MKSRLIINEIAQMILEGGAVGHLMHLYDNRDLTFDEIFEILTAASEGRLEKASEKLDGINLVFSWDESTEDLKVARSGGDIKRGGMNAVELASKFSGRGNLEDAFNIAFKILSGALGTLPTPVRRKVFGNSADFWYSVEIIYSLNPNVINYDTNNVVFHGWPVFKVDQSGNIAMSGDDSGGVDILSKYVQKMQNALNVKGWQLNGPALVRMKKLSDGSILTNTMSRIKTALSQAGLSSESTIGEYLRIQLRNDVQDLNLSADTADAIVARCMQDAGAPNLVSIRKIAKKSEHETINEFVRSCPGLLKSYVRPIEMAINDFAVELLKGLESTLISDSGKEVERLRSEVSKAISAIQTSGDEAAMTVLARQMAKLKTLENITSPVEGIVFTYKGNAYKFTGSFAAANQILGLFRFGRGGTKLKISDD